MLNELKVRIENIENQLVNLAKRESKNVDASDERNRETKDEIGITTAELEETAITMADFLAEYYLSQLGVDDFEMEGGEGE